MANFEYTGPLSVASLFVEDIDLADFIEYLADKAKGLVVLNANDPFYIPPIVYSEQGRAFNVEYNFIINCLSEWVGCEDILSDFKLAEYENSDVFRNGVFLISSIFDTYFGVAKVHITSVDFSRFKTKKIYNVQDRFYNVLVIGNGQNYRRFSAVPFSESALKKVVSSDILDKLMSIPASRKLSQVAFGLKQYGTFCNENKMAPRGVLE